MLTENAHDDRCRFRVQPMYIIVVVAASDVTDWLLISIKHEFSVDRHVHKQRNLNHKTHHGSFLKCFFK